MRWSDAVPKSSKSFITGIVHQWILICTSVHMCQVACRTLAGVKKIENNPGLGTKHPPEEGGAMRKGGNSPGRMSTSSPRSSPPPGAMRRGDRLSPAARSMDERRSSSGESPLDFASCLQNVPADERYVPFVPFVEGALHQACVNKTPKTFICLDIVPHSQHVKRLDSMF